MRGHADRTIVMIIVIVVMMEGNDENASYQENQR